jgi:hypothetical protein
MTTCLSSRNNDAADLVSMLEPHDFAIEKSEALQRLADQVELILHPPDKSNVVPLTGGKRAGTLHP